MTKQQGGGGVCSSCNDPNFATVTVNRGGAVVCAECGKVFFSPSGDVGHVSPPADHECREPLSDAELLAEIEALAGRLGKRVNMAHERGLRAKVHWIVETEVAR